MKSEKYIYWYFNWKANGTIYSCRRKSVKWNVNCSPICLAVCQTQCNQQDIFAINSRNSDQSTYRCELLLKQPPTLIFVLLPSYRCYPDDAANHIHPLYQSTLILSDFEMKNPICVQKEYSICFLYWRLNGEIHHGYYTVSRPWSVPSRSRHFKDIHASNCKCRHDTINDLRIKVMKNNLSKSLN